MSINLLTGLTSLHPLSHTVGELIVAGGVLTACVAALWSTVMWMALQRTRLMRWWRELPLALALGAATALLALVMLPPGAPPGLAELGYALPTPHLTRWAAVFGLAAAAWAWPLLALRRARRR